MPSFFIALLIYIIQAPKVPLPNHIKGVSELSIQSSLKISHFLFLFASQL
ncbi:MAG: hypothetical protein MESAZ_02077 [Saezia sanguinis]